MILQKVNNKLNLNAKIYMHKIKHTCYFPCVEINVNFRKKKQNYN